MRNDDYKKYLASKNASSIKELDEKGLVDFASKFLDKMSNHYLLDLCKRPFGFEPDWSEVASFVERAFLNDKSFAYAFATGEALSYEKSSTPHFKYFVV